MVQRREWELKQMSEREYEEFARTAELGKWMVYAVLWFFLALFVVGGLTQ